MTIEYALNLCTFDTAAVEAAFKSYIEKCQAEIAAGNRYPYVAFEQKMHRFLKKLERAEMEAFMSLTQR